MTVRRAAARSTLLAALIAAVLVALLPTALPAQDDGVSEVARRAAEAQEREDAEEEETADREAAEVVLTRTPRLPDCPAQRNMPGNFTFWPAIPGRVPYNCLEWGFCSSSSWSQPELPGTSTSPISVAELLERAGFDATPVDCEASEAHHVILVVWLMPASSAPVPADGLPADRYFQHAMKRLDGEWSSKNGKAGLHTGIGDTDAFLDRWYPVPPGRRRVIRCFERR